METKEKIQICGLVVILIAIAALIFVAIIIIKRAEEIRIDPVEYATKHTAIESCVCMNSNGDVLTYPIGDRVSAKVDNSMRWLENYTSGDN